MRERREGGEEGNTKAGRGKKVKEGVEVKKKGGEEGTEREKRKEKKIM